MYYRKKLMSNVISYTSLFSWPFLLISCQQIWTMASITRNIVHAVRNFLSLSSIELLYYLSKFKIFYSGKYSLWGSVTQNASCKMSLRISIIFVVTFLLFYQFCICYKIKDGHKLEADKNWWWVLSNFVAPKQKSCFVKITQTSMPYF